MMSRSRTWHAALCMQMPFLMGILLVLSSCTPIGGTNTPFPTVTVQSVKSFSVANLFKVVTSQEFTCNTESKDFFSAKSLVLATDRLIYDQAEVNRITTFVDSQGDDLVGHDSNMPSTPPDTLKYITGSAPDTVLWMAPSDVSYCEMPLTVTNISQETLQIPRLHLRYENSTEPNTQRYRLINVCSIGKRLLEAGNQEGDRCPHQGAGSGEGYTVSFTIGRGVANAIYSAEPGPFAGQGPLPAIPTLRPGDAAKIDIQLAVTNYTSGLSVFAIPEFVVTSSNGTQTLPLTQLKVDIAIAAPRNVSCYALHGTTFVEQNPLMQDGSWCI